MAQEKWSQYLKFVSILEVILLWPALPSLTIYKEQPLLLKQIHGEPAFPSSARVLTKGFGNRYGKGWTSRHEAVKMFRCTPTVSNDCFNRKAYCHPPKWSEVVLCVWTPLPLIIHFSPSAAGKLCVAFKNSLSSRVKFCEVFSVWMEGSLGS